MTYQKQTWVTGETITEQKLNHMEDGIANAILIVNATRDESTGVTTLDKTWQQIHDANYAVLVIHDDDGTGFQTLAGFYEASQEHPYYGVNFHTVYETETADGYPYNRSE